MSSARYVWWRWGETRWSGLQAFYHWLSRGNTAQLHGASEKWVMKEMKAVMATLGWLDFMAALIQSVTRAIVLKQIKAIPLYRPDQAMKKMGWLLGEEPERSSPWHNKCTQAPKCQADPKVCNSARLICEGCMRKHFGRCGLEHDPHLEAGVCWHD